MTAHRRVPREPDRDTARLLGCTATLLLLTSAMALAAVLYVLLA